MNLNEIAEIVEEIDHIEPGEMRDPLLSTCGGVWAWNVSLERSVVNSEESEATNYDELKKEILDSLNKLADEIKMIVERTRKGK